MVIPGLGMLTGGAAAGAAQAFATDDGYFEFTPDRVSSDGVAVAATDLWLDGAASDDDLPGWVLDLIDADLRLHVAPAEPTDDVFVGIARRADVEAYLADAGFSDIVEMDGDAPIYEDVDGGDMVGDPGAEPFWAVAASGADTQEVEWEVRDGEWSVVVMNTDGAPGVAADVEVGLRSGAITPIAIGLIVAGTLVLAGCIALVVVGTRGLRRS